MGPPSSSLSGPRYSNNCCSPETTVGTLCYVMQSLSDADRASFRFLSSEMADLIDALHGRNTTQVNHAYAKMRWLHRFYNKSTNTAEHCSMTYGEMSSLQHSWQRFFGVADTQPPLLTDDTMPDSILTLRFEQKFECTTAACTSTNDGTECCPTSFLHPNRYTLLYDHAAGIKLKSDHSINGRILQETLQKQPSTKKCQKCHQGMALTAFRVTQSPKLLHIAIKNAYDKCEVAGRGINGNTLTVVGGTTYDLVAVMYGDDRHFISLIKDNVPNIENTTLWKYDGLVNNGAFCMHTPRHTTPPQAEPTIFPFNLHSYYANALIYARREEFRPEKSIFQPITDVASAR
jgi:hypothetical protein